MARKTPSRTRKRRAPKIKAPVRKQRAFKKRAPAKPLVKWQREGFSSYRQYMNARYRALGFSSYSDYTERRKRGEVPSTKGLPRALPGTATPHFEVTSKPLPPVGGLVRISYESVCPFRYDLSQPMGAEIVAWLRGFVAEIKLLHRKDTLFSAAWRIFGRAAMELDDSGAPVWTHENWEEWSSHMDFDKSVNELYSLARAYGNHEFVEFGRQIGRGKSRIFALIITRVKISVTMPLEGKA